METSMYKSELRTEDKLGRGSYSIVFKGYKKNRNKTPVAIKQIVNDKEFFTANAMKDFKALLAVSGHVNIIELFDLYEDDSFIFIIMEYCNAGDLEKFLSRGVPSYTVKLDIMKQCTAGISYIHGLTPPVVHRDIKPNNILFQESPSGLTVKIADFGLAKVFTNMNRSVGSMYMSTDVGSLAFRAPELFKFGSERQYTATIDNYALGLVFAVLINYTENDKTLEPNTVDVAREPYLSFGQRQLQAQNEHLRTPSLYLCPQFAETHPRMKTLIVNMTCLDAKKRTNLQLVQSQIDQEISDQHEEAGGVATAEFTETLVLTEKRSTSRIQADIPQPETGARPKQQQKLQTSKASPVKTAKVKKQPSEISEQCEGASGSTSASNTVSHPVTGAKPKQKKKPSIPVGPVQMRKQPTVGASASPVSYRRTDRRLSSIKQITPVKEGSFKIRNKCFRFCHYKDILFFPCLRDKCIDCYSIHGEFLQSLDLSTYGVDRPRSVHPLTGDSLLLAAWTGLYEVGTGEGGECRRVLQGWFEDVHVSEGVVAVLVGDEEGDCHRVHILQASDLSSPRRTITLTHREATTVLLHHDSLCVSSGGVHNRISVYSLSTGELTSQYGRGGFGAAGELYWPHLSACDVEGGLLVVDYGNLRLQTLSVRGEWAVLPGLGEVRCPWDAVIVGDRMLVLDLYQNVHVYKMTYK